VRVVQHLGSSDSEDSEPDYWQPFRPRLRPARPEPPDTTELDRSELRLLTAADLGLGTARAALSLPRLLHHRALGGAFSGRDRRRLGAATLPHNPAIVASFKNKVFCGTFARGGDIFMSACQDRKIRIYDTSCGGFSLVQTIEAQDVGWSVLDVALSPDGAHLVYSSWSDSLHQVNILDKEDRQVSLPINPDGRQFCIFSVSFSQDSQELLCGANDGYIYLYDRFSNRQSLRVSAHEDDVNAVCFLDDTTHTVASGGDDGLCKVWDRRALREDDPKPVGVLAGHVDGIAFLDPKGDGRHLISNSKDQSIKLWDIRCQHCSAYSENPNLENFASKGRLGTSPDTNKW
jgi:WD repeat-containing protein 23